MCAANDNLQFTLNPIKVQVCTIEARWVQGLTDLKLSTVSNLDNYSYYHRSLMILGGLSF